MNHQHQGDAFPLTRHSVVAAAQSSDAATRAQAVETIAVAYWKPVYKYVRVRWDRDAEDARDLTQEFFARLIENEFLGSYDPAKGRLRTFLRTCVDRLLMNLSRDARREKRGGGAVHISLDFDEADREMASMAQPPSLDDYFEKEWMRTLFALGVEKLRAHCESAGKMTYFRLFEEYDLAEQDPQPTYAELSSRFGLSSTTVTNYLAAVRRDFRWCVLEQLREMTGSEQEFVREAQALLGGAVAK